MGRPPEAMTLHEQIRQRQIGLCGKGQRASFTTTRLAYSELVPNHTIYKVQVPLHHIILRFTPDGKYLVCMSSTSNAIYLYNLRTCVYPWSNLSPPNDQLCFSYYFGLKYKQLIETSIGHHLCKDFCLVLSSGKFMILASSTSPNDRLNSRPLETTHDPTDYTFYSIEIETGKNISQYTVSSDFLRINQNACVSIYNHMLAILSLTTQAIKLVLVDGHGVLHELKSIGKFLHSDDQLVVDTYERLNPSQRKRRKCTANPIQPGPPQQDYGRYHQHETFVRASLLDRKRMNNMGNGMTSENSDNNYWDDSHHSAGDQGSSFYRTFQQALLSKLFRDYSKMNDGGNAMRQFYRNFDVYANLKFWEIQFLDEQKLLIKMLPGNAFFNTNGVGATNALVVFIVFNIQTSEIEEMFDQASERVVELIHEYANTILGTPPDGMAWFGSNCTHHSQSNFKTILPDQSHSKSCPNQGSRADAIRRLATQLPIISQSYMDCPYYDRSLFTCDERLVSPITSNTQSANEVIKFYSSVTNQLKFKIDPNPSCNERQPSVNRKLRSLFHIPNTHLSSQGSSPHTTQQQSTSICTNPPRRLR